MSKRAYDASHHDAPVRGIANILWWEVWGDVAAEMGVNLSGKTISRMAPPAPAIAFALAERYMGAIEHHNKLPWPAIMAAAWKADYAADLERDKESIARSDFEPGRPEPEHKDYHGNYAMRFGECLVHELCGSGVAWTDDHAEFMLGSELLGDVREFDVPLLDCGEARVELEPFAERSLRGAPWRKTTRRRKDAEQPTTDDVNLGS